MVWDYGVYDNYSEKDGHSLSIPEAIANGQVVVWLEGKKLRGGYALIRTRVSRGRESWLLIKMHDEWAKAGEEITTTEPDSALTGRGLETIEIEGQQKAA